MNKVSNSKLIFLYLLAIFFEILNLGMNEVSWATKFLPLFNLMMVFYFTVITPVFSIWFIFLLGVWGDSLSWDPIGATSLCYIVMTKFFFLLNKKMFLSESFIQIWYQFCGFCLSFLMLKWAVIAIFNGNVSSFSLIIVQFVLTSIAYVPMHRFFDYLHTRIKRSSRF